MIYFASSGDESHEQRYGWIDCVKAIAIFAVVMDHSSDFFFNNRWLTTASYFAVALFILLSGLTLSLKHNRCPITLVHQIRKIAKLFAHYAFATLI